MRNISNWLQNIYEKGQDQKWDRAINRIEILRLLYKELIRRTSLKTVFFYLNQGYRSYKDNRKIYYGDYYILGQIVECANLPKNITNYVFKDREVKLYWPRNDQVTGNFQGLYEIIGYIIVRGNPEEHFFDYGFCKENSKLLYSYHKRIIPSSFSGTFFNRYKINYESNTLPANRSNVYFFLPFITDRVEKINRYLGSVNLSPIDIDEKSFGIEESVAFDPSKFDVHCSQKKAVTEAIVKKM